MHTLSSDTNSESAQYDTERVTNLSLYFILLCLLIAGIYAYSVHFLYGFSLFPDEFGYWSPAAAAVGYDWSQITSLGYYYSFGYSLILTPILAITGGGVTAYRAAVAVNAIMQCVSIWLLYGLLKQVFPKQERNIRMLTVSAGVLYPVWIYYMQLTMVEATLTFMYILVCYTASRYMERPTVRRLIPALLSLTYMYYLHMRTISIFAAGIIILVIRAVNIRKTGGDDTSLTRLKYRRYIAALAIVVYAVAAFALGECIKSVVMDTAYAHSTARQLGVNDYSGQVGRLGVLLDISGYTGIIRSLAVKIMYLGMSSFGMVYIAIIYMVRRVYESLRGKIRQTDTLSNTDDSSDVVNELSNTGYTFAFILFTASAQIAMIAITSGAGDDGRLDALAYGRYIEHISPVLISVGVSALANTTYRYRYVLGSIVYNAITTLIAVKWSVNNPSDDMHSFCIAGISYLWDIRDTDIVGKYLISLAVSTVTMFIVYLCVYISEGKLRRLKAFSSCGVIIAVITEIILGMHLSHMYVYPSSRADELDTRIVKFIEDDSAAAPDKSSKVLYLSEGNPPYVDVVQFGLKDISIDVVRTRSRRSELGSSGDYPVSVKWIDDDIDSDYDGDGDMYRLTDDSVVGVLQSYEGAGNTYIITDLNSTYEDTISERYKRVMDTMWLRLYVPRD